MIPTRSVPEVLDRARALVVPALRDAIATLTPELRPIAEYHLGWLDVAGNPTGADGGKGVRPALAVLSAEAVGAAASVGVPGAVAVELVHNFSLIHDDVIDEDTERRHRPTVWALFGIGRAVIVGDALNALAQQLLLAPPAGELDVSGEVTVDRGRAARCLAEATAAMIAGQALDMAFESVPSVDVAGCLAMEAGKTGALLGCAASLGALLAGSPDNTVEALNHYGIELGLAFQAVDDLLGIWGDPARTGKPAFSDLRQHKKTLPVAAALAEGGSAADELAVLLASEHLEDQQVAPRARLVEVCGGRAAAGEEARRRLALALAALESVELDERARVELAEVASFVVEREF